MDEDAGVVVRPEWAQSPLLPSIVALYISDHRWIVGSSAEQTGLGVSAAAAWPEIQSWVLAIYKAHLAKTLSVIKQRRVAAGQYLATLCSVACTAGTAIWTWMLPAMRADAGWVQDMANHTMV